MIFKNNLKSILGITLFLLVLSSCNKNKITIPTIEILGTSGLTSQSVLVQVKLNNPSNVPILEQGVCWFTTGGMTHDYHFPPAYRTLENISLTTFSSLILSLQPNTTYYVQPYFLDKNGYHYGNELTISTLDSESSPFNPNKNYGSLSDINGNIYKTIEIGNQTWMAENLKVSDFNDGTPIFELQLPWAFNNLGNPYWCNYNDDVQLDSTLGKIYNSNIVTSSKNVCPTGWHIPTSNDVLILRDNLNVNNPSGSMKSTGYNYWNSPNNGATNESGFSSIGSGERNGFGSYSGINESAKYWVQNLKYMSLSFSDGLDLYLNGDDASEKGFSIRCIKD